MAYSYFERLVLFFSSIPILLMMVVFIYALGGSVLGRVIPFLKFSVDDRYISRDVTDVYYLDFLIGAFLNKVALLSVL